MSRSGIGLGRVSSVPDRPSPARVRSCRLLRAWEHANGGPRPCGLTAPLEEAEARREEGGRCTGLLTPTGLLLSWGRAGNYPDEGNHPDSPESPERPSRPISLRQSPLCPHLPRGPELRRPLLSPPTCGSRVRLRAGEPVAPRGSQPRAVTAPPRCPGPPSRSLVALKGLSVGVRLLR